MGALRTLPLGFPVGLALSQRQALVVDENGNAVLVPEPEGAPGPVLPLGSLHRGGAAAAYGAGRFLVVSGPGLGSLAVTMLREDGTSDELSGLAPTGAFVFDAAVVFDGATFLVAWVDGGALRLRRVFVDGRVDPMITITDAVSELGGASLPSFDLVSGGNGNTIVAYTRDTIDPVRSLASSEIRARVIQSGAPNGTACVDAMACGSGVCADGVCCATACDGACLACGHDGVCASTCIDAGPPPHDAGPDARARDAGHVFTDPYRSGCGCHAQRGSRAPGWLVLLAWLVTARRRRS